MNENPKTQTLPAIHKRTLSTSVGIALTLSLAIAMFVSGIKIGQTFTGESQTAGFFGFFNAEETVASENQEATRPNIDAFWEVWDVLEDKYATGSSTKIVSTEDRINGALKGLVNSYGDPYTVYFPPVDASAFSEDISGNFSGVGMEIGLREGLITVISPLPDTPAENAGLVAGDIIVKINGSSTEGMRVDEAVRIIRGEKGTIVEFQVYREGEAEFLDISVTRDNIDIPTVKTEQIDDVFIVTLYSFNAVAEPQIQKALIEYTESDSSKLIFDLRGNPGGFLDSAVAIASYFLPSGKVVVREQFGDPEKNDVYRSRGTTVDKFDPQSLVVLVDGGSASASEILAGALKDHAVATIIGEKTFGKGSVQQLVELGDGSAVKVTIARWLTPNNVSISQGGLTPDITIKRTPQQRIAGEDPQKEAALRFLAGEEVVSETLENQLNANESTGE